MDVGGDRGSEPALRNPGFSGTQSVENEIVRDGLNGGRISPQTPDPGRKSLCPMASNSRYIPARRGGRLGGGVGKPGGGGHLALVEVKAGSLLIQPNNPECTCL